MDFQEHRINWTRQKIAAFWDHFEDSPGMQNRHFSKQRGLSLLRNIGRTKNLETPVLDLGCGSGHLLSLLLKEGIESWGADVSERSIEIVGEKFDGDWNFKGVKKLVEGENFPFESSSIGTVFLLETIEHLLEEDLYTVLGDILKILRPSGLLIVTTPDSEKLEESEIICTNCGCKFHRVQHLRSLSPVSLRKTIEKAGFEVIRCSREILLPDLKVWLSAQRSDGYNSVHCPDCYFKVGLKSKTMISRLKKLFGELGHLVCIAKKR